MNSPTSENRTFPDSDSSTENHHSGTDNQPPTAQSTESSPQITWPSSDTEDYVDHDKEISLKNIETAEQALHAIQASGFFTQPLESFLVLTSVTEEVGNDLLKLLDQENSYVRKGFFIHERIFTIKMPSYTHEMCHAWFVRQIMRWHADGHLTAAEQFGLLVGSSPRITALNSPYTGGSKEPDVCITPEVNPPILTPTVVVEVGFSQSYISLVHDAKFWLEGVGVGVRKVILVKFFRRSHHVSGTIELWGRDATGSAYIIFNNRIFPDRGRVERPIYLTREDLFNGVVHPGRQATDRLDLDIASLRRIIATQGLGGVGLTPAT